jgi:hypothetical protein
MLKARRGEVQGGSVQIVGDPEKARSGFRVKSPSRALGRITPYVDPWTLADVNRWNGDYTHMWTGSGLAPIRWGASHSGSQTPEDLVWHSAFELPKRSESDRQVRLGARNASCGDTLHRHEFRFFLCSGVQVPPTCCQHRRRHKTSLVGHKFESRWMS